MPLCIESLVRARRFWYYLSQSGPGGTFVNKRVSEKFSSELFTNAAIEFLENHKGDKPFYAYVAYTAPHDPRNPPMKYRQMYYKKRPPLPKNFKPQHPFDNGHMVGRDENLAPWPRTEDIIRDQLAEYYGLVTHLDEHIGRVLEALRKSRHADNTIIIYAADRSAGRPIIILCMADDQGWGEMGYYGHPALKTPSSMKWRRKDCDLTDSMPALPSVLPRAPAS